MQRRKRYIFGGAAICIALGVLLYTGLSSCSVYYYTVSEILEEGEAKYGENVRVSGTIVGSSIEWDFIGPELRFLITDGLTTLPVIYEDEMPHTFEADKEVVLEGKLDFDGFFYADDIVMKCASKYEGQD